MIQSTMSEAELLKPSRPYRIKDITGRRYGRLTIVSIAGIKKAGDSQNTIWNAACDCGNMVQVHQCNLKPSNTNSCGCYRDQRSSEVNGRHRMAETPTFHVWQSMKQRCTNPNNKGWADYGGRGISVCERWMEFENFVEDMGVKPDGLTLERKDNEGPYCKSNCIWATRVEQARNKRNTIKIGIDGMIKSVSEWAEISGIGAKTIKYRLKRGWLAREAVFTPVE